LKAEHYFLELSRSIKNLASKADLLIFEGKISKKDFHEIFEDVLVLHIFYMSVFRESCPLLTGFLEKKNVSDKMSQAERKRLGAFFTPPYIAEYMVAEVLKVRVEEAGAMPGKEGVEHLASTTICDPAMGGGIFLVCAQDFLMQKMLELDQTHYSIGGLAELSVKNLYGVDINQKAVDFSKMILQLNTAKWKLLEKFDEFARIAQ